MKKVFALAVFCILSSSCFAQWTTNGSNINFITGTVSVGTTLAPTGFKLAVGGSIIAEEVVIKLQAAWPDYVFEPTYQKLDLYALERFIARHKHLPEVPSAAEVEASGISVGEMNAVLLKKVEELTLYIIELKKETDALRKEVETLKQ